MANSKKLTTPSREFLGWVAVTLVTLTFFIAWQMSGYWIWKSNPSIISMIVFASAFSLIVMPFLVVSILYSKIRKKNLSTDVVRSAQICLPIASLFFALASTNQSPHRIQDFKTFKSERLKVVEQMRNAELPEQGNTIAKEVALPNVSAGNRIYLYKEDTELMVFFPTLPYMIDNHAGFVYSESGNEPPRQSFYEVTYIERLDKNWFWIRTT